MNGSRTPRGKRRATSIPLVTSLRDLRWARHLVVSHPEILGGDPVFRGTRVPVHLIADLAAQGADPAELIEEYPRISAEMIQLGPVYAAAYPLRTHRRKQPWRDCQPARRRRRRLDVSGVSPAQRLARGTRRVTQVIPRFFDDLPTAWLQQS